MSRSTDYWSWGGAGEGNEGSRVTVPHRTAPLPDRQQRNSDSHRTHTTTKSEESRDQKKRWVVCELGAHQPPPSPPEIQPPRVQKPGRPIGRPHWPLTSQPPGLFPQAGGPQVVPSSAPSSSPERSTTHFAPLQALEQRLGLAVRNNPGGSSASATRARKLTRRFDRNRNELH